MHSLVIQLQFSRQELLRCVDGISESDAKHIIPPMNSISWMVGHLADQENRYWVWGGQRIGLFPELNQLVGFEKPQSNPPFAEMLASWKEITSAADGYLGTLTPKDLMTTMAIPGQHLRLDYIGSMLYRSIYHYWFHLGEAYAIRQLLGHKNLPTFIDNMDNFKYFPEA